MEFKSIVVALLLLAVLFGWYALLESGERRRGRRGRKRAPDKDEGGGRQSDVDGELWKAE